MKNLLFLLCLIFFIGNKAFAQSKEALPLYTKNYIQIDPFYLNYQINRADNSQYSENNKQFISSRPSILFYLNIDNYIFRPFISINPSLSSNEGSFAAGKLFEQAFEVGLYSLLNHSENVVGNERSQNGIIQSQFLLGPYFVYYPYYDNGKYFEIDGHVAYEYSQYKTITSGSNSNISEQKGINFNISLLYSLNLNDKVYFSPNVSFTYFATQDYGGNNTIRNGYDLQIIPISFQIPI